MHKADYHRKYIINASTNTEYNVQTIKCTDITLRLIKCLILFYTVLVTINSVLNFHCLKSVFDFHCTVNALLKQLFFICGKSFACIEDSTFLTFIYKIENIILAGSKQLFIT